MDGPPTQPVLPCMGGPTSSSYLSTASVIQFRVSRTREALLYRDPKDSMVSSVGIVIQAGRQWRVQDSLEVAESQLRHKYIDRA